MEITMKHLILILILLSSCNWFKQDIDKSLMHAIKHRCEIKEMPCSASICRGKKQIHNYEITELELCSASIKSLRGLNANNFPKLKTLDIRHSSDIRVLNYDLPDKLKYLKCENCGLTELPSKLPYDLENLYINHNSVKELPNNLSDNIIVLDCHYNKISTLPDNLPDSLVWFNCAYNLLTELPENLPDSLKSLNCRGNPINKLPEVIPSNLEVMYIDSTSIKKEQIVEYKKQCPKLQIFLY